MKKIKDTKKTAKSKVEAAKEQTQQPLTMETTDDFVAKEAELTEQIASLTAEKEQLAKSLQDLQEQDLRLRAEYDNFRRRTQQEKERIFSDAMQTISKEILPLYDNLLRASATAALQAAQVEGTEAESIVASMQKGNDLVLQQAQAVFMKLGISEISPLGATFDPQEHAAVMHIEDDNYGENEIVEVFEKGYKYGERVLRPAVVKVAN